jgi:hypothetical protein
MKTKAIFYTATITKNEFQEDVHAWSKSFETGVKLSTMRFTDLQKSNQIRNGIQLFCTTRKNPNTLSVRTGDKVVIKGEPYIVRGVDPRIDDLAGIMFLLDHDEGSL